MKKKTDEILFSFGAGYHFFKRIDSFGFLAIKAMAAVCAYLFTEAFFKTGAIVTAILGSFVPEILLMYMNKRDNERMLPEIKLVYHALIIRVRAGVYITDALAECYTSVTNRRLRDALYMIACDIAMKADVNSALLKFRRSFRNEYINALCTAIEQALESGRIVELLDDIRERLKSMETLIYERRKQALDRRVTIYQLMMLFVMMGIALYACFLKLMESF